MFKTFETGVWGYINPIFVNYFMVQYSRGSQQKILLQHFLSSAGQILRTSVAHFTALLLDSLPPHPNNKYI